MIFSGAIKRMMERGLLALLTRWPVKLGSEFCCLFLHTHVVDADLTRRILLLNLGLSFFVWFLHTHGVDTDLTKKRDHKSCLWILVWVFVVWLGQIVLRCEIKKILHSERLDLPTRDISRLWSDLFTVYSQALVRRYNKGHHQSCSSFSIKVVVVRLGQIIFRCEIKKMLSRELYALPQIEITMLWSEISLLAHESWSMFLLFGMVTSFAGARSRKCWAESCTPCHR